MAQQPSALSKTNIQCNCWYVHSFSKCFMVVRDLLSLSLSFLLPFDNNKKLSFLGMAVVNSGWEATPLQIAAVWMWKFNGTHTKTGWKRKQNGQQHYYKCEVYSSLH